ncbi:MAG: tetratricopeptide repeat protein [Planctomycetes bacterium]|nr:tetratricopeptide repeat protein [Planctomycetota bacterium]
MQKAEELLREGRLEEALANLQEAVRNDPAKAELRVFLFQLLAVLGRWDRALTQLNVAAEMDGEKLLLAEICRPALACEALREEVFAGKRSPLVFGEPDEWVGWLIEANRLLADGQDAAAGELRDRAFEAAPAIAGTIDGKPFEWLADADTRLGPIIEAMIDGKYFWIPMTRIKAIRVEEPKALRNVVWAEAQFTWTNGGQAPGLIPARYPGTQQCDDGPLRLGRRTEWSERPGGHWLGLGQRMLTTDESEYPLLGIRNIVLATEFDDESRPGGEEPSPPRGPAEGPDG